MKRFFSLLLIVSISTSLAFADAYREALVKYVNGTQDNIEQLQQSLGFAMQQVFPDNPEKAAQILGEYFSTQASEDIADIYEPSFRKYVSREDLDQLLQMYSDPRYQEMSRRSAQVMAELAQSPEFAQFTNQLTSAIQSITVGGTPEPLPVSASVTADYRQLFHSFYNEAQIGETLNKTYTPVVDMIESSLSKAGVKDAKTIASTVLSYISSNTETLFLNIYSNVFTQDDLHLLIEASASPAQKKATQATQEVVTNPFTFAAAILTKMSSWLQSHYPDYAEPFDKSLQELQKLQ